MKKHHILAAAVLTTGATLIEIRTGWIFGSDASAAGADASGQPLAAAAPAGIYAVARDRGAAPLRPLAVPALRLPARPAVHPQDVEAPQTDDTEKLRVFADAGSGFARVMAPTRAIDVGGFAVPQRDAAWTGVDDRLLDLGLAGRGFTEAPALPGSGDATPAAFSAGGTLANFSGVPEPASWMSMIVGMLMIGINARRRQGPPTVTS